jgi:hypothetical protein
MTKMEHDVKKSESTEIEMFLTILEPLKSANLSTEHRYQLNSLIEFHTRFNALEKSYGQIFAQVAGIERNIADYKSSLQ